MLRPICLTLALLCPFSAVAEPLSFSGTVAIGANDVQGGSGIGFIDATLTVPLTSRVPLTLEIGGYLFALDSKRPHETYVNLSWDDTWRVGAVRPAYDFVLPSVFERAAPYLAYERAEYARSHATVEAMRRTAVPWGLSWTHSTGDADLMVSLHDASKGNFRAASVAFVRQGDGWQISGAVEALWTHEGVFDGLHTKLGGRATAGPAEVGLTWLHPDSNDRPDALAMDVIAPLGDRLDLMAFGEFTEGGMDDAYGIGLDYGLRPDSHVLFAVTDGARGDAVHMTLERRF